MSDKVTWEMIYKDFKVLHPRLSKKALGFKPHSFATILIMFPDRVRMTYNYDTKEMKRINKL